MIWWTPRLSGRPTTQPGPSMSASWPRANGSSWRDPDTSCGLGWSAGSSGTEALASTPPRACFKDVGLYIAGATRLLDATGRDDRTGVHARHPGLVRHQSLAMPDDDSATRYCRHVARSEKIVALLTLWLSGPGGTMRERSWKEDRLNDGFHTSNGLCERSDIY